MEPFSGLSPEGVLVLSRDFRVGRLDTEGAAVGLGFSGADFLLLAGVFFSVVCFSVFFFNEDVVLEVSLFKFLLLILMAGESVFASSAFFVVVDCFLSDDFAFSVAGESVLASSAFLAVFDCFLSDDFGFSVDSFSFATTSFLAESVFSWLTASRLVGGFATAAVDLLTFFVGFSVTLFPSPELRSFLRTGGLLSKGSIPLRLPRMEPLVTSVRDLRVITLVLMISFLAVLRVRGCSTLAALWDLAIDLAEAGGRTIERSR